MSSPEAQEDDEQGQRSVTISWRNSSVIRKDTRSGLQGLVPAALDPVPEPLSASGRWGRQAALLRGSAHCTRLRPDSPRGVTLHSSTPLGSRGLAQGLTAGIRYMLPFIIYR